MKLDDLESQGLIERVDPNLGNVKKALERANPSLLCTVRKNIVECFQLSFEYQNSCPLTFQFFRSLPLETCPCLRAVALRRASVSVFRVRKKG